MLNDDDGLPNLICAKCKRTVESLENHTEFAEGHEKSLAENPNFHYYIILTSLLYRVRTLTSHDTEESENSPESPHLERMRKQCVRVASFPGPAQLFVACSTETRFTVLIATESWAGPGNEAMYERFSFFARAGDEAISFPDYFSAREGKKIFSPCAHR